MDYSKQEQREILLLAIKAGEILLKNGAEISRVEDTVGRICRHYGFKSASTFVLSNGIFLTSGNEEETQFAQVRQIPVNNTNLSRVAEVNQLSRRIEAGMYTLPEIKAELNRIEQLPAFSDRTQILTAGFSGACLAFILGGNVRDFLCSLITGCVLYLFILKFGRKHFSKLVRDIVSGALVAVFSIFFYVSGLGTHLDALMIGGIILLVPGVAFTNAIRDMAGGDYISGSVRMIDAVLVFFCIAIGVGFVIASYNLMTGGGLL